jgi:apolipoprotein N-acyltransferase
MATDKRVEPIAPVGASHGRRLGHALPWLALAALLLLFANGRNTISVAAWLAPLYLLRWVRSQGAWRGLTLGWLVLSATWAFQFRGMAPVPGVLYFILAAVYGLVGILPFALDRVLAPRVRGFRTTLILPSAWVVTEHLVAQLTPYGSWGSAAYTQYESLILLQVVSLTGIYGITFLIAWFAALCNWMWELGFKWPEARRGVIGFAAAMAVVLIYGGTRLALFPSDVPTVRVASLTRSDIQLFTDPEVAQRALAGSLTEEEKQEVRRLADQLNEDLLRRAETEARSGAKIIFWGETNSFVFKEDEQALIERGAELARSQRIYLGIAVGTWNGSDSKPLENKLLLIDPEGNVVWDMWKARPVPGSEAAISALDDGRIKSSATPYGTVGAAICFDMDFPGLLKQAGQQHVDLMLVPSNDWREIDPWHTHMARVRAIEQGFNLVRHTSGGLSLAADYQGRVLSSMDHYTTSDRVPISHVPMRGTRTLYARVGDLFAWICIGGLLASVVLARRKSL